MTRHALSVVWEEVMGLTSWRDVKQGAEVVSCELDPWRREDSRGDSREEGCGELRRLK